MDAVFLHFRKPFAMVLHKRLMIINVRALIIQCLDWELTGRKEAESHRLVVNGVPSDCTAIHSGVPERVTLGSPPFVIIAKILGKKRTGKKRTGNKRTGKKRIRKRAHAGKSALGKERTRKKAHAE